MNHFELKRGVLHAEGVSLEAIADEFGTPTYVYSTATLTRHIRVMREAFSKVPSLICYSVKACSNLSVLNLFANEGAGFDIVSGGELARVRKAGGEVSKVVFSGVGKTEAELEAALKAGILAFNVESEEELLRLDEVGRRLKKRAPFSLRVNPDVDPKTHKYIATGLKTSKFGVPFEEALSLYERSRNMKGVVARGLDCHIGSQLTDLKPVREAVEKVADLYRVLQLRGLELTHLDVGGGLGVTYTNEAPPSVADYAAAILEPTKGLGATLVLEPGRAIVANAAVLICRALYRKETQTGRFLVVDAGMNDLLRPALYEAHHDIRPVRPRAGQPRVYDVVGPVCESSDVLGSSRRLSPIEPGDVIAIMTAGAYGMSMASTYNSRARPAEVLVDGKTTKVIRQRDSVPDLWRGETIP